MTGHDNHCLDLLYGYVDAAGTFHPPLATPENDWKPHTDYHSGDSHGWVRECGYWHPEGAVTHNRANCWLRPRCSCGKPFPEDGGAEGICECCSGCAGGVVVHRETCATTYGMDCDLSCAAGGAS